MKTHINTMVKNEGLLLDKILPIWKTYPVDFFVFYNDNSTDDTCDIIAKHLDIDKFIILNDELIDFNESHNRSRMSEYSRDKCDYIIFIDSDELLSSNIVENYSEFIKLYDTSNLQLYWYNVIDSLDTYRFDSQYRNAFGGFITKTEHLGSMNLSQTKYHTCPRYVNNSLPTAYTNQFGIIHLQSLNRRYYALKQLWYKHFEFKTWGHSIQSLNSKYDPVVNNFEFNSQKTPLEIIKNIDFDIKIFEELSNKKGYLEYIKNNYNEDLVTFGREYL
jgi:hypothetical protein